MDVLSFDNCVDDTQLQISFHPNDILTSMYRMTVSKIITTERHRTGVAIGPNASNPCTTHLISSSINWSQYYKNVSVTLA